MKIIKLDLKQNFFEIIPDSIEELWVLEKLIQKGDLVSGYTERKIKATQEGEKAIKKTVYIQVKAEKIEFHKDSKSLRILGEIVFGRPEELIELKTHHTIEAKIGKKINVKKEKLMKYQIDLLEKAKKASMKTKITAIILDDEETNIYSLSEYGTELKATIKSEKQGKQFKTTQKDNYFEKIINKIKQLTPKKIIIAGPGFTREKLYKEMKEKNKGIQIITEPLNSIGKTGLNELIQSGKIKTLEKEFELENQAKQLEEFLKELTKEKGLAEYGLKQVKQAIELGAGKQLLILDELLLNQRKQTEEIIELAEKTRTPTTIISIKTDAGKKLKGLGGIGLTLRYKVN